MPQQTINIGIAANDGTGDPLRTAFTKSNANFTELYSDVAGRVTSTQLTAAVANLITLTQARNGLSATLPLTYNQSTGAFGINPASGLSAGSMSAADFTKLAGIAAGATTNATDADLRDRATHTGTQAAATISDFSAAVDSRIAPAIVSHESSRNHPTATTSLAGLISAADKTKLDGVAAGATANATDAQLRDRATHTGTQTASTISDFAGAVDTRITLQRGAVNGLATLGSDQKIPFAQLPAIAITDTFVVASEAAMLALTAEVGDVAVRTDESKSYILRASPASTLGNWQELLSPPATGGGGGEANTASNIGAGGVGVFAAKSGVDLRFRNINAASSKILVALDGANNEIDIDLGTVAIADITGLTSALAGKQDTGPYNTHVVSTGNGSHIPSGGITDANVATGAAISWAKVSKSGAAASDVGAAATTGTTAASFQLNSGGTGPRLTHDTVAGVLAVRNAANDASFPLLAGDTTVSQLVVNQDAFVFGALEVEQEITSWANTLTLNSDFTGGSPTANCAFRVNRGNPFAALLQWSESPDRWQATNSAGSLSNILLASDLDSAVQAYDADLQAIAALSTTGFIRRTGAGTAEARSLVAGDIPDISSTYQSVTGFTTHTSSTGNGTHIPSGGIADANVAVGAAIGWAKISKSGAVASDVGALATGAIGSTVQAQSALLQAIVDGFAAASSGQVPAKSGSTLVYTTPAGGGATFSQSWIAAQTGHPGTAIADAAAPFGAVGAIGVQEARLFDASTRQVCITKIRDAVRSYANAGWTLTLLCSMSSATSGNVVLDARVYRYRAGTDGVNGNAQAAATESASTAVPGTVGSRFTITIAIPHADLPAIANGDYYQIVIGRKVAGVTDNASGNLELLSIQLRETGT